MSKQRQKNEHIFCCTNFSKLHSLSPQGPGHLSNVFGIPQSDHARKPLTSLKRRSPNGKFLTQKTTPQRFENLAVVIDLLRRCSLLSMFATFTCSAIWVIPQIHPNCDKSAVADFFRSCFCFSTLLPDISILKPFPNYHGRCHHGFPEFQRKLP